MWVADNNEKGMRPCDGHVKPLRIAEKSEGVAKIDTHQRFPRANLEMEKKVRAHRHDSSRVQNKKNSIHL